jgi:hypothetical protein
MENYLALAFALLVALVFVVLSIVYIKVTIAVNLIWFASTIISIIIMVLGPNRQFGLEMFLWSLGFYLGYWSMMLISVFLLAVVGVPIASLYTAIKLMISEFSNKK